MKKDIQLPFLKNISDGAPLNRQSNCISLLRLVAALSVFTGHASVHLQVELPKVAVWAHSLFDGVPIFFFISGFLIYHSLTQNSDLKIFASKRLLRLYPELWCAVGLSVVSLLVLYREQLQALPFAAWIATQSSVLQFWTPDCLRGFGCGTPNGSLWTVGVMVQSYIVIFILFRFLHNRPIWRWVGVTAVSVMCNAATPLLEKFLPAILVKLYGQTFLPYLWIFLIGAFLSAYFNKLMPFCKKFWYLFFAVAVIFNFTNFDFGQYGVLKTLFFAPALLGFAYCFPRLNIKHDITYGLYLYHMVVLNVFIHLGHTGSYAVFFIALAITAVLSAISYIAIGRIYRNKKKKEVQHANQQH